MRCVAVGTTGDVSRVNRAVRTTNTVVRVERGWEKLRIPGTREFSDELYIVLTAAHAATASAAAAAAGRRCAERRHTEGRRGASLFPG